MQFVNLHKCIVIPVFRIWGVKYEIRTLKSIQHEKTNTTNITQLQSYHCNRNITARNFVGDYAPNHNLRKYMNIPELNTIRFLLENWDRTFKIKYAAESEILENTAEFGNRLLNIAWS